MKRSTALGTIILVSSLVSAVVSVTVVTKLMETSEVAEQEQISPVMKAIAKAKVEDSMDRVRKAEEDFRKAMRRAEHTRNLVMDGDIYCNDHGGVAERKISHLMNVMITNCKNEGYQQIQKYDLELN